MSYTVNPITNITITRGTFDIVIPLGPNERNNIEKQITFLKQNIFGYRNIYIISYDPSIQINDCIIIDETVFPFSKNDVGEVFLSYKGKNNRNGWYLQQLLKLYAGSCISGILDTYLVVDADVFFLKPIEFIRDGKYYFTTSTNEYHKPYFDHMKTLHPSFEIISNKSAISHHMMFHQSYLKEMMNMVEEHHSMVFWKAFLYCVQEHKKHPIDVCESGASEYEIYLNFMLKYHKDKVVLRELHWDIKNPNFDLTNNYNQYSFVSLCHWIKW